MTNQQIIEQMYHCFAAGDMQGVISTFSNDAVWNEPGEPDIAFAGTFTGIAGISKMLAIQAKTIHVKTFVPKTFCTNENTVVVLGHDTVDVLPTGKTYTTEWVQAFTLANGKITNVQVYMDTNAIAKAFKAE